MLKEDSDKKVDPVSGNEIPVGATAEEVRDDVDAKLSVGEFVLPADVVRYIGLNNIMKLRDAAKAGLERMEMQGQMGNGDEQVVDDHNIDVGSMIEEITEKGGDETEQAFAMGGIVQPSVPVTPPQYSRPVIPGTSTMISSQQTPVASPYNINTTFTNPYTNEVTEEVYVGPNKEEVTIRFSGSVPIDPIPIGYVRKKDVSPEVERPEIKAPEVQAPVVDPTKPVDGVVSQQQEGSGRTEAGEDGAPGGTTGASSKGGFGSTSTDMALASVVAQYDPEVARALANYKEEVKDLTKTGAKIGAGAIASAFVPGLSLISMPAALKGAFDLISVGYAKDQVIDSVASARTGVAASLLDDWATTDRSIEEVQGIATTAMNLGASPNFALAMAIDDRFDADTIMGLEGIAGDSYMATFEEAVSNVHGVQTGSDQASRLAKEDFDFFDGDLKAMADFYGEEGKQAVSKAQETMAQRAEAARVEAERVAAERAAERAEEERTRAEAAAIADSGDIGGSDYGSVNEAQAVADYGFGSDEHFGAIDADFAAMESSSGGSDSGGGDSYCCTKMVEHGLWNSRREFALMHKWHKDQPTWWKEGYDVWGKVVAETFLKKASPFWSSVMQSFYARKINKAPLTAKTILAYAIIYPGVIACGSVATIKGVGANAGSK